MKKIIFILCLFLGLLNGEDSFSSLDTPSLETEPKDVWNISVGGGYRVLHGDIASFSPRFNGVSTSVQQSSDSSSFDYSLQIDVRYGLDHVFIPGLSLGLRLDYAPTTIDIDLTAQQAGSDVFRFNGNFLTVHNIGFIPFFEFRTFTLLEHLTDLDLPAYFELSFNIGPRVNLNFYDKGNLDIEDEETFSLDWEFTVHLEFFLSSQWAWRLGYGFYENSSEFEVVSGDLELFDGELDLQASRIALEIAYYF